MKGCVYILECENGRYYIGSTINVERRVRKHEAGAVASTKNIRPVRLVFQKGYAHISDARRVEYKLKKLKNKKVLKKIIQDRDIRMGP